MTDHGGISLAQLMSPELKVNPPFPGVTSGTFFLTVILHPFSQTRTLSARSGGNCTFRAEVHRSPVPPVDGTA